MSAEMLLVVAGWLGFAAAVGVLVWRNRAHAEGIFAVRERDALVQERDGLAQRVEGLRGELEQARQESVRLETEARQEREHSAEKLALLGEARKALQQQFENLAQQIFEQKQRTFQERSGEQLTALLNPLRERIREFETRVNDVWTKESRERHSLAKEVRELQTLNSRLSADALNLTNALKGQSKTQGLWGEMVLERVLEQSGLQAGREYELQVSIVAADGGRQRPDVVVRLPQGRDVVIDAKVALTAYERYVSAGEDEAARGEALQEHVRALRNHVRGLAGREYQRAEGLRSLDFVLLFVPIEGALHLAIEHDEGLLQEALGANVALVAPTTLLATLRTIENMWRNERQNSNAQEIAVRAGALYDKFVGFVKDLDEVGGRLEAARGAWEQARNKLVAGKGNLVARTERLRGLGARAQKQLPEALRDEAEVESALPAEMASPVGASAVGASAVAVPAPVAGSSGDGD